MLAPFYLVEETAGQRAKQLWKLYPDGRLYRPGYRDTAYQTTFTYAQKAEAERFLADRGINAEVWLAGRRPT